MKATLSVAALLFTLNACSSGAGRESNGSRHRWTQPDVLRIAIPQDVKTLNPLLGSNTFDFFVQRFMFEPLLTADERGNPLPMLARLAYLARSKERRRVPVRARRPEGVTTSPDAVHDELLPEKKQVIPAGVN